jgi:hypothetical protein
METFRSPTWFAVIWATVSGFRQADPFELATAQKHLREPAVIADRRAEAGPAGKILAPIVR